MSDWEGVLERLYATIASRKTADPGSSYTAKLLHEGRSVIAKKMGEEAVETAIAAVGNDSDAVVAESADLIYHLLVLWVDCGIEPAEVWKKLAAREGTSGLAEKAVAARRPEQRREASDELRFQQHLRQDPARRDPVQQDL